MNVVSEITPVEQADVQNENPFLKFIPVNIIKKSVDTVATDYDAQVIESFGRKEIDLYTYIVQTGDDACFPAKALRSFEAAEGRGASAAKKGNVVDVQRVLERIYARPNYDRTVDLQDRIALLEAFKQGDLDVEGLQYELEVLEAQVLELSNKVLDSDMKRMRQKGSCIGSRALMITGLGADTTKGKKVCLSCPVYASCAIITLFGQESIGIRMAMSERQYSAFRSTLGARVLKSMLATDEFETVRDSMANMFMEFQELIDPDTIQETGKPSKNKISKNKLLRAQLLEAIGTLMRNHGFEPRSETKISQYVEASL